MLKMKMFTAAFLAALALSAACVSAQNITDADILTFALNLEYLEAEFYHWAAYGTGIPTADRGGGPASTGGKKALLSPAVQAIATEIANDELAHVRFLRAALGSAAVPMPMIDIGPAFSVAADVALNVTLSPSFSPYGDDTLFLHGAFIFEDVGVTAYKGAAPLITTNAYVGPAAGILAVEAYHAGIVRTLLAQMASNYVFPYGAPVSTIVQAISNLRGAVSGGGDQGILGADSAMAPSPAVATASISTTDSVNLVPADANAIAFSRTPEEVLDIVYLGSASKPGGFFPMGLNGNIK